MNYFIIPGMITNENKLEKLLIKISKASGVSTEEIKSRTRKSHIVDMRKIYCYIASKRTDCSLSEIGAEINRDHSTVIYSRRLCEDYLKYDDFFRKKYEKIIKKINL